MFLGRKNQYCENWLPDIMQIMRLTMTKHITPNNATFKLRGKAQISKVAGALPTGKIKKEEA